MENFFKRKNKKIDLTPILSQIKTGPEGIIEINREEIPFLNYLMNMEKKEKEKQKEENNEKRFKFILSIVQRNNK